MVDIAQSIKGIDIATVEGIYKQLSLKNAAHIKDPL